MGCERAQIQVASFNLKTERAEPKFLTCRVQKSADTEVPGTNAESRNEIYRHVWLICDQRQLVPPPSDPLHLNSQSIHS